LDGDDEVEGATVVALLVVLLAVGADVGVGVGDVVVGEVVTLGGRREEVLAMVGMLVGACHVDGEEGTVTQTR